MAKNKKDDLYTEQLATIGRFAFDEKVAMVFPDMINRSVPAYATIVDMIGLLANRYAQQDSNCYDLGCSLGATSMAIRNAVGERHCRIFAIDNSEAMLKKFREQAGEALGDLELVCEDVRNIEFEQASFVALNFTLQFLPQDDRLPLLRRIHDGMREGSCLVLSEKVEFASADEEAFHDEMHTLFKAANGYSELEISQKRVALENVLIRDSIEAHRQRLRDAGFDQVHLWFQCFNFVSLVALRD